MAVDDSYTRVLLHGDGADEDTVFTDEAGNTFVATALTTQIYTDTAQKKFGASSIRHNAFTGGTLAGLELSGAIPAELDPTSGDFTLDYWIRFATLPTYAGGEYVAFLEVYRNSSNQIDLTMAEYAASSGKYYISSHAHAGGVNLGYNLFGYDAGGFSLSVDTWYHMEFCRSGNNYMFFLDGVLIDTVTESAHTFDITTGGTFKFHSIQIESWMEEIRWSVGIARHTTNFTPATSQYQPPQILNIEIPFGFSATLNNYTPPVINGSISIGLSFAATMSCYGSDCNGSITLPLLTLSATAIESISGRGNMDMTVMSLTAEGYDSCLIDSGISLPLYTLYGEATTNPMADLNSDLPFYQITGIAEVTIVGTANLSLPRLTTQMEGEDAPSATTTANLPMFRISATALIGAVGTSNLALPSLEWEFESVVSIEGTADITIPSLEVFSETSPTEYTSLVMNIKNNALSLYTSYAYNSFCRFKGQHYGAKSDKIFLLEGEKDDGTEISWNFRLPYLDLEKGKKRKLRQAWYSYKSNGDILVTIILPDGTEYEYALTGNEVTEDGVRVKFGRGIKTKYVSMDVKNKDGSDLSLDAIKIHLQDTEIKR